MRYGRNKFAEGFNVSEKPLGASFSRVAVQFEGIEGVKALGDGGDSSSRCTIGEVGYARGRRGCPASGDPRHDPSAKVCEARDIMHSQDSITEHRVAKVFAGAAVITCRAEKVVEGNAGDLHASSRYCVDVCGDTCYDTQHEYNEM
jgi:hypothetical protein